MKVLLGVFIVLFLFLSVSDSEALNNIERISIVNVEYVKLNDPWKLKINSIGISQIDYVKLVRSDSKVVVEYCRKFSNQIRKCNKNVDRRFSLTEAPPYYVSLEIYLKHVTAEDSAPYTLLVEYGVTRKDLKNFNLYILQKPEIVYLKSASGTTMNEGSEMNIVCRVKCGLPSGIYNIEVFNSASKRWVDMRTSEDTRIKPGNFQPAIMERKITKEFFVREFTKVRCRVRNEVGTTEKTLDFKVGGKLDYLNPDGPLIVACSVPNPPLLKGSELVCTQSKNSSWPPVYIGKKGYKYKVGLYTAVLEGNKRKYTDLDEGSYTCSVDNGAVKLCTRQINGDFKNVPKVKILSYVPTHKYQTFIFQCDIPSVFRVKAFALRGKLQSESWEKKEERYYNSKIKPSNIFKIKVGVDCTDMLVTCQIDVDDTVKISQISIPIFCALPGTLRLYPPRFEEPVPLMSKLEAVGLSDPERDLTYVWDRLPVRHKIYADPGPNLIAKRNVLTIPADHKYRGVHYKYRCYAYKREGRKSHSSNVIEFSFNTAMCSFKPYADILLGIYTNMNPHCSLNNDRYNVEETWFELFYKPFISDVLLSLPIGANYTRVAIFPTTDSKERQVELTRMRSFAIGFNESHLGRKHVEQLFQNNIYRLNSTPPHTTSARSCELGSFAKVQDYLSELRPSVQRIFLYSLDLYDHHMRKKFIFSSIHKDTHSYVMKSLSKELLLESDRYFSNLLDNFNKTISKVNEVWLHYGSYCPEHSCPHLALANLLGVHQPFTLVSQTSSMFEYGFERQWFPLAKYSLTDPKSMKCFIRTNMPGLRISRLPTFKRICEATTSRMDPSIIEVSTAMASNCLWNSNQFALCTAMLGKPAGKLTLSYLTSSADGWLDSPVKLEKETSPELNGNTFVRATAKIFVHKNSKSFSVRCKVKNSWNEVEKSITYRCTRPRHADPVIQIKPSPITEDEEATIICYTKNWFVGKLCLKMSWGDIIQCKNSETDSSTGKLSIVHKIPKVKQNMDNQQYVCTAENMPMNKTEETTATFRVHRAKVRDTKIDFITGPDFDDKTKLEKNIQHSYWFTVRCSSLVGSAHKMGSTLTVSRFRKGNLDVSFNYDTKSCSKDPPTAFRSIIFTCKTVPKFKDNSDLLQIHITIKSAKFIQDKDEYRCFARNIISKAAKNVTTLILSKPNIITFKFDRKDKRVLLYCDVSCVPRPEVTIKIIESTDILTSGKTIPLTEIRPGVCRLRYLFQEPEVGNVFAVAQCTDSANFLGKKVTVKKTISVLLQPAVFNKPRIYPDPAKHHEQFTVDCNFTSLHIKYASSVLLFKTSTFSLKNDLPCMVYKKAYQRVTGIWKNREASVRVEGSHIKFKIKYAVVKDAGSYQCYAFYDSGGRAMTKSGSLSKVLIRPIVNGIFFYGNGSGDNEVQKEKTKVLLGCQVNLGNKEDAKSNKILFKVKDVTLDESKNLHKKTTTLKDGTTVVTVYVIKASISNTFHNTSFSCIVASDKEDVISDASRLLYVRYYPVSQTITPRSTQVKDGEFLTCHADGFPEVTYLWFWNVGKLRITSAGPRLPVSSLPRGSVEVECSAQNDGKPSVSLKRKTVIVNDGGDFFMSARPRQPIVGERFALECPFYTEEPSAMVEWFRREGSRNVFIAEWTPYNLRVAPALEQRNISVDIGDKATRLVFSKARLEDSGAYRCRYQDATESGFLAMSGIDAKSSSEFCVFSPPKCRIQLVPYKSCYEEHDKATLMTEVEAELDGCHKSEAPGERYFVVLIQPKPSRGADRARLFSSSGHVRTGGRSEVDIAVDAELDRQRLFCAVADIDKTEGGDQTVAPFEADTSRVDLCVRHTARRAVISRHAGKNGSTRLRCAAKGNPWPRVELTARGPGGWNRSVRGIQAAQLVVPRGTRGKIFVECVAKNNVSGKEHVLFSAEAIQIGQQATASSKMTQNTWMTITSLTAGTLFAVVGMGIFIYWKVKKVQTTTSLISQVTEGVSGGSED